MNFLPIYSGFSDFAVTELKNFVKSWYKPDSREVLIVIVNHPKEKNIAKIIKMI